VELYLVVEGVKDGLPFYCTPFQALWIDGRRLVDRIVAAPAECGLVDAEIRWGSLRPTADLRDWERSRAPGGQGGWSLPVQHIPGEAGEGIPGVYGTSRWAASIKLPSGKILPTDGWAKRRDWANPDLAPGFVVSRGQGTTLAGRSLEFARLPLVPAATKAHARARVAVAPCALPVATAEELYGVSLEGDWTKDPTDEQWSWLFETVEKTVLRTEHPEAWCVSGRGRGVAWADRTSPDAPGVRKGDVFVTGDRCAILEADDGDGWLGNDDRVLHAETGQLARGPLSDLSGRRSALVRLRNFRPLREDLAEAGYGELGLSWLFGADLQRALTEFQRDRGMETTGIPDEATTAALAELLGNLRAADTE
jgi:hypothetical protein